MPANVVLGLTHIGLAILMIVIHVPLLKGRIAMNPYYGFRIRKSFQSHENWYLINSYGARKMISWSALLVPLGVVEMFLPFLNNGSMFGVFSVLGMLLLVVPVFQALRYANRL